MNQEEVVFRPRGRGSEEDVDGRSQREYRRVTKQEAARQE